MAAVGARAALRRRRKPIQVMPYVGYGTAKTLTVCGRVLEDERFTPALDADSRWRNLVRFWKYLESDEVPGARLRARHNGIVAEAVSDAEGYFRLELQPRSLQAGAWQRIRIEMAGAAPVSARVLVPPARAKLGVISDIDDTVIYSHVTRKVKMVLALAFSNARTRKPFKGVAAFYRALHAGVNPVFYVSKSPWNLYAPLVETLAVQGLPEGPLLLRDFGLSLNRDHKREAIEKILLTYPALPFVLIGDSGEADPEIYAAIVRRHPERIRTIYIRSVNPRRVVEIDKLAFEVSRTGCQLVLAPDSAFAAAHAAAEGLIQPSELRAIRADAESDRAATDSSSSNAAASSGARK